MDVAQQWSVEGVKVEEQVWKRGCGSAKVEAQAWKNERGSTSAEVQTKCEIGGKGGHYLQQRVAWDVER